VTTLHPVRRIFGRREERLDEPAEAPRAARPGELPPDGPATVGGVELPRGVRVAGALWVTEGSARTWGELALRFPETGLWPVLIAGRDQKPDFEPSPGWQARDAAELLPELWSEHGAYDEELAASMGAFPGLGRGGERIPAAHDVARQVDGVTGLALVAVERPADVFATTGWLGAVNSVDEPWQLTSIARSWEERYDAILVGLGFDTAWFAVRRPPGPDQALRAAAELYMFCPDIVEQGADTVEALAESLPHIHTWMFWWD
jgi:hypothetical protein